jgi:streptogramin lyase
LKHFLKRRLLLSALLILIVLSSASSSKQYGPAAVERAKEVQQQPFGSQLKTFKISTNQSGPEAIIQDLSNTQLFWFSEYSAGRIGELWQNGTVRDFGIPETGAQPVGLAMDSHGNIWFVDQATPGSLWQLTPSLLPSNQAFKQYHTKTLNSVPYGVVIDPSGNVWFTEGSGDRIGEFPSGSDSANNMTEYPTPTPNSGPTGIAGQKGTSYLWIAESYANKIARFDTTTDAFQEFSEPLNLPLGIGVDQNNNIWISEHGGSSVDVFMPSNSTFRKYPTSPAIVSSGFTMTGPASVSIDSSGRVWFVEHYANRVGMLDPSRATIEEFAIPYDSYSLLDAVDTKDNFWLTEFAANQIAMINVTASIPVAIEAPNVGSVVPAGNSISEVFSVIYTGSGQTTINLTSASSFKSSYTSMASEVSLNASSVTLNSGKQVSIRAVITPDISLSSGLYAIGLAATYGNSSVVKEAFLSVSSNQLYQFETILPYILVPVGIAIVLAFIFFRRRRMRGTRTPAPHSTPKLSIILILALLGVLSIASVGTSTAKCPGLPPPPGGYNGPDPYGIALDVGSIAFFAIVAYFLIRSRLRGQSWAKEDDQAQATPAGNGE